MKFDIILNLKYYFFLRKEINTILAILLPGFLFLFFPILGCLLSIIITFILNDKKYLNITFIYLYCMLILIQGQRIPLPFESGDWNRYIESYNDTLHSSVFNTNRGTKDICYTFWNFLFHPLFGNNGNAFLSFTLDTEYLFWGLAAHRLWKYSGKDARTGLCSIVIIFFFSEILSISNNLVRQQFASSIIIWAIILRFTKGKYWYIFLIWGLLTHSMTIFFLPLFFIPINRKPRIKNIVFILLGSIMIGGLIIIGKNILLGSSFYVFQKIGSADEYFGKDVINPYVIYKFAFVIILIYLKHYIFDKRQNPYIWVGLNILSYITLICLFFVDMPLIVTRIYIERLPLLSFVLPYFFTKRSQHNSIYLFIIIMFFFIRFAFMSHSGYVDISVYAIKPLILLL